MPKLFVYLRYWAQALTCVVFENYNCNAPSSHRQLWSTISFQICKYSFLSRDVIFALVVKYRFLVKMCILCGMTEHLSLHVTFIYMLSFWMVWLTDVIVLCIWALIVYSYITKYYSQDLVHFLQYWVAMKTMKLHSKENQNNKSQICLKLGLNEIKGCFAVFWWSGRQF